MNKQELIDLRNDIKSMLSEGKEILGKLSSIITTDTAAVGYEMAENYALLCLEDKINDWDDCKE